MSIILVHVRIQVAKPTLRTNHILPLPTSIYIYTFEPVYLYTFVSILVHVRIQVAKPTLRTNHILPLSTSIEINILIYKHI